MYETLAAETHARIARMLQEADTYRRAIDAAPLHMGPPLGARLRGAVARVLYDAACRIEVKRA